MRQSMDKKAHTRIIDGCLQLRSETPYSHDIRIHDLGHGHTEATVMPRYGWSEVDSLTPLAQADYMQQLLNPPSLTPLELLDKVARHRDKATQRAKTAVRRQIKSKNLNQMITLTYQDNVTDRDTHLRNFDVFIKRVRRLIPSFEYVVTHELQKRGAWHSHLAVHRILPVYTYKNQLVKSYTLLTHLWRSSHTSRGAVMVSPIHSKRRSVAFIALYLAKYIGKDLNSEVPKYGNSYSASSGTPPMPMTFKSLNPDLMDSVIDLHDLLGDMGNVRQSACFLPGDIYYLAASPP